MNRKWGVFPSYDNARYLPWFVISNRAGHTSLSLDGNPLIFPSLTQTLGYFCPFLSCTSCTTTPISPLSSSPSPPASTPSTPDQGQASRQLQCDRHPMPLLRHLLYLPFPRLPRPTRAGQVPERISTPLSGVPTVFQTLNNSKNS